QAAGKRVSEAADWYSFGVVLFEALTGKLPKLAALSADLAGAPRDLAELCLGLLSQEPQARPGAAQVLRALGGEPAQGRASAQPPAPSQMLVGRSDEAAR